MHSRGPVAIASFPAAPWKNGGGSTRTLAMEPYSNPPGGAPSDDFLWRISLAEIASDGPFSSFPGIDRTILLWRGDGVVLHSPSWPNQRLVQTAAPFTFRGEDVVTCSLVGGTATDLNLMTRRGAACGGLAVYTAPTVLEHATDTCVLLCNAGQVLVQTSAQQYLLPADHMLHLQSPEPGMQLTPTRRSTAFVALSVSLNRR